MSIVNAWVGPENAWVGVDTGATHVDGVTREASKMVPLVHLPAVIAGRGCAAFLPAVVCNSMLKLLEFDELAAAMPEILRETFDDICKANTDAGKDLPADFDKETIVLVGWSRRRQKMLAFEYVQQNRESGFLSRSIGPYYFSPWIAGRPGPLFRHPLDSASMIELAESQICLIDEHAPDAAGGGRYLVAYFDKQRMSIETICEDLGRRRS